MSCPPKTSEDSAGSPLPEKADVSVSMPVGGCSPAARAAHPATTVVATEPRAPISQTPTGARGGRDADMGSLLSDAEPEQSPRKEPEGPGANRRKSEGKG